jgi:hypothetical protein
MPLQKRLAIMAAMLALSGCGSGTPEAPAIQTAAMSSSQRALGADVSAYTPLVQQLYVAFFGRAADPDGLAFHAATLARLQLPTGLHDMAAAYGTNADVRTIIDSLANSAEAQALYGGAPERLITALYLNSFNRDADAPGLRFWVDAIQTHGLSTGAAITTILASAQGSDVITFERKAEAASMLTTALDRAEARALYAGHGPNALVRDLLGATHSASTDGEIGGAIDAGIAALKAGQAWTMGDGYAEVPGGARSVALLVAPAQHALLRARLDTLATVLAADLNARAGQFGPVWRVDVVQSATSVPAVRAQLRGRDGAILIGDVVVPTRVDLADGQTYPDLTPYRAPDCARYQIPSGTQVVQPAPGSDHAWIATDDPACRNGMTVSILRGTSAARQPGELTAKLDQMIGYHRAPDASNARWTPAYQHVNALWMHGAASVDGPRFWDDIPLYERSRITYIQEGRGQERLDAFRGCLSGANEMCAFNGHGTQGRIVAEGPDPTTAFHSNDAVDFTSGDLAGTPIRAKFINLQSCSTQNFLNPDSFGTSLLTRGDALLVLGSTGVVFQSIWVDKEAVQSMYQPLAYGATFAEAFAGKLDSVNWGLQGDPFISLRPKPSGPQPKLAVDGKHYNVHPAIARLALGDSTGSSTSFRTVRLANRGNANLTLRLGIMATNVTARDRVMNPAGGENWNLGFGRAAPAASREGGFGNVGDIVHVVPPGGELQLRLSFEALTNTTTGRRSTGVHTSTYEIHSNDPQMPRVVFELMANAR